MSTPVPDVTNGDIVDASWGDAVRLAVSELQANVAPAASAVGDTSATGTNDAAANADHRHAREGFGAVAAASAGDASANGTATTVARSDHKHGLPSSVAPAASTPGDTAVTGTSTSVARADHRHARNDNYGTGVNPVASVGSAGASGNVARADHAHGLLGDAIQRVSGNTGALAAGATITVTLNWPTAFGGTPTVAVASVRFSGDITPPSWVVRGLSASQVLVRVTNNDASSRTLIVDAIGIA